MSAHPAIAADRVAVVTGGASGIGFAVAERLGQAGMRVVLADLPGEALEHACERLEATGVVCRAQATDVGDPAALAALADAANAVGEVSLLLTNAGREGGGGILPDRAIWTPTLARWSPISTSVRPNPKPTPRCSTDWRCSRSDAGRRSRR